MKLEDIIEKWREEMNEQHRIYQYASHKAKRKRAEIRLDVISDFYQDLKKLNDHAQNESRAINENEQAKEVCNHKRNLCFNLEGKLACADCGKVLEQTD